MSSNYYHVYVDPYDNVFGKSYTSIDQILFSYGKIYVKYSHGYRHPSIILQFFVDNQANIYFFNSTSALLQFRYGEENVVNADGYTFPGVCGDRLGNLFVDEYAFDKETFLYELQPISRAAASNIAADNGNICTVLKNLSVSKMPVHRQFPSSRALSTSHPPMFLRLILHPLSPYILQ